ncbi:mRNA splicing protein SMX3 [Kluyveromyces lactis]|uniref:Sm protein F n=1 Tax=Kluyveromyces lactis (strain ATCC 8585 / CBS 2359 / DSM 70799 / NBRC 1267 / NRRL Y-1140 / WM37) TaxID=284590 RepID=Q6CPH1_KLULA|nr:uncharacterized protein KLLA0_E04929g [Kluyveromyces lactis]CAG99255.1 KLLA0E04929p [Kluyveromyces lactis]|eukprot:XP_454168.1 uncharacterized protein KLLA0_E04929g [Kluyveromyces lactis]
MDPEEFKPINPKPFLHQLIDKDVLVTLKFNKIQYKGRLVSVDTYFNLQLTDAEEIINDVSSGKVGDIFIRCNNVLYVGEDVNKQSDQPPTPTGTTEKSDDKEENGELAEEAN